MSKACTCMANLSLHVYTLLLNNQIGVSQTTGDMARQTSEYTNSGKMGRVRHDLYIQKAIHTNVFKDSLNLR